jgi:hypothetical protein
VEASEEEMKEELVAMEGSRGTEEDAISAT